MARHKSTIWPWILVALWVCVIWGHSLMSGEDSSSESQFFTDLVRGAAVWLSSSEIPWLRSFIIRHPGIINLLSNPERLHYIIRKVAHFSEYFVLGLLVLHAARRTLSNMLSAVLTIALMWACVPGIDETIQRFVPGRAGMFQDVLIDMGGFGTALAIGLPVIALSSMFAKGARH